MVRMSKMLQRERYAWIRVVRLRIINTRSSNANTFWTMPNHQLPPIDISTQRDSWRPRPYGWEEEGIVSEPVHSSSTEDDDDDGAKGRTWNGNTHSMKHKGRSNQSINQSIRNKIKNKTHTATQQQFNTKFIWEGTSSNHFEYNSYYVIRRRRRRENDNWTRKHKLSYGDENNFFLPNQSLPRS